jgi:hypothetical protein
LTFTLALFLLFVDRYTRHTRQFVWVAGSSSVVAASFGSRGVFSASNTPGGRSYACAVIDPASGNVLMYGGSDPSVLQRGDIWSWNGIGWRWLAGSNMTNPNPVYGSKGVGVSAGGTGMGGRMAPSCWYASGIMYIGFGSTFGPIRRNDLWTYNKTADQLTWIAGSSQTTQAAIAANSSYSSQGTPSPTALPNPVRAHDSIFLVQRALIQICLSMLMMSVCVLCVLCDCVARCGQRNAAAATAVDSQGRLWSVTTTSSSVFTKMCWLS